MGAPTIALKTAGGTLPGAAKPGATLPKATVALSPPTKPLTPTSPGTKPAVTSYEEPDEVDESGAATFFTILAGVGFAAALIVLGIQLKVASTWINAEDNPDSGSWSQLIE